MVEEAKRVLEEDFYLIKIFFQNFFGNIPKIKY